MKLAYRIVNVFTVGADPFSGNPLCVFEDGRGLSDDQMQALARQLNLSETTFVLPSEKATAHVRIFTPSFEMPFVGHPTLGTAHVVRSMQGVDSLTFEMQAGIVPVRFDGDRWTLTAAKTPASRTHLGTRADIARMVGHDESSLAGDPLWIDTGAEQLIIPLVSAEAVRAASPDPALMLKYGQRRSGAAMAYVWARESESELLVRFFFEQHGALLEDPATGSACANLGGYLLETLEPPFTFTLSQGAQAARPSSLGLHVDEKRAIHVSGACNELGRGVFEL